MADVFSGVQQWFYFSFIAIVTAKIKQFYKFFYSTFVAIVTGAKIKKVFYFSFIAIVTTTLCNKFKTVLREAKNTFILVLLQL